MGQWRTHYHIVWTVQHREPVLVSGIARDVFAIMREQIEAAQTIPHALGGCDDHVHLVVSILPRVYIPTLIKNIKGNSSRYINTQCGLDGIFRWQRSYGIKTVCDSCLERVVQYVRNQRVIHARREAKPIYEIG